MRSLRHDTSTFHINRCVLSRLHAVKERTLKCVAVAKKIGQQKRVIDKLHGSVVGRHPRNQGASR